MGSGSLAHGTAPPRLVRAARLPLGGFVLLVLALAGAGAYLSLGILSGSDASPSVELPKGPFGTDQDIPVSFGVIAVSYVNRTVGVPRRKIQGGGHGVNGLVPGDKVQIEPGIAITNLLEEPVAYSPGQFRLVVGRGEEPKPGDRRIAPVGGTFEAGSLQPTAAIEGRLTFVAPRNRSRLWLEFKDPARSEPVLVDLGRTGRTPPEVIQQLRDHRGHK